METKYLEYFEVLYETQNLHKAADRLYISQQGLSRAVRKLEEDLETKLFDRDHTGMHPTPQAERLYKSSLQISRELADTRKDIRTITEQGRTVHIVCSYGVMHLLYDDIKHFQDETGISVRWEEYPDLICEKKIQNGEANIALTVFDKRAGSSPSLLWKKLAVRRIMLLVPAGHPLASRDEVHIKDLREQNLICEGEGFYVFRQLQEKCLSNGFYPSIAARTSEINLCHKLVAKGAGLGITVDFIADMVSVSRLKAVPFAQSEWNWEAGMASSGMKKMDRFEKEFWNYLSGKQT